MRSTTALATFQRWYLNELWTAVRKHVLQFGCPRLSARAVHVSQRPRRRSVIHLGDDISAGAKHTFTDRLPRKYQDGIRGNRKRDVDALMCKACSLVKPQRVVTCQKELIFIADELTPGHFSKGLCKPRRHQHRVH